MLNRINRNLSHPFSSPRWFLLAIILLGMGLRWNLWTSFHLREDEALYGYWAWLIYSHIDPMLKGVPVDKPPLFPYLLGWLYGIFYPSEAVVRLPSLLASTLSLPLFYGWACALLGRSDALPSLVAYALMPLAILMSPTAYMDGLMVGLLLLSAWLAARTKPSAGPWAMLSGVSFSLALATKPLALLWGPLIVYTAFRRRQQMALWLTSFVLGAMWPLWRWWQWEQLRGEISTWNLAVMHYGGQMFLPLGEWSTHFLKWMPVLEISWGGLFPFIIVATLTIVGGFADLRGRNFTRPCLFLATWLVGTLALYSVSALQPWDRYLLLLIPPWALVVGHGWTKMASRLRNRWKFMFLVAALWVGFRAGMGAYPLGSDHGAYNGLDTVMSWVMKELPRGGIVYHRWLGWHYGFYLFGTPYDYRWWPDINWLVEDWNKVRSDGVPRLIVFPAWHERERYTALRLLERSHGRIRLIGRIYDNDGHLRFWIYATK